MANREKLKTYQFGLKFSSSHGSGKPCLFSL